MANVLRKIDLFPPCFHLCAPVSPKKSSSAVGFSSLQFQTMKSSSTTHFNGQNMAFTEVPAKPIRGNLHALHAQMNYCISKALKWWEKGLQPNMKAIQSAVDLVDSLSNGGNNLIVVDFFSPGCGGCKALYPKICQFAEQNPDIQFLLVNYEEHKSMCYSLNIHVLPFFRFYRGAHGRLCSFSCTNATVKKFKDALAKHTTDRCDLGPPKGLEESELLALAASRDLSFNYANTPVPASAQEAWQKAATSLEPPLPPKTTDQMFEKTLTTAGG